MIESAVLANSDSKFPRDITKPFHPDFDPLKHSLKKSHFQSSFCFVRNPFRRQALNDFYAYCRLVDDISDLPSIPVNQRREALREISTWLKSRQTPTHPYWDRLQSQMLQLQLPVECFEGILRAVESDLKEESQERRIQSWDELEDYAQGVAGDVGTVVLCILGAQHPEMRLYAKHLGRCVQYLNILRDIEHDAHDRRFYIPEVLRKELEGRGFTHSEIEIGVREELYKRALESYAASRPYSWKCLVPELMVGIYLRGAKKYWRYGRPQRLSKPEKAFALIQSFFQFTFSRKKASIRA